MKNPSVISFFVSLIPVIIMTTIAVTQLESWGYTGLGDAMTVLQLFYVIILLPISIGYSRSGKKQIGKGILTSFFVCIIVSLFVLGMGL